MGKTRITTEDFKTRARLIHGDRYDYSDTLYSNRASKVAITCKKHGPFLQAASSHLRGHGCLQCSQKRVENYMVFIKKLNEKHGWQLQGGNSEFSIPSKLTPAGKYRFDGVDTKNLIFFEYNERSHHFKPVSERDKLKKERLREWLRQQKVPEGKAKYVVYDEFSDTLTVEVI